MSPLSKWWTPGLSKDRHDLYYWLQNTREQVESLLVDIIFGWLGIFCSSCEVLFSFFHTVASLALLLLGKKVKLLVYLTFLLSQYTCSQYMRRGFCLKDLFWKFECKSSVGRVKKPWLSAVDRYFYSTYKEIKKGAALKAPYSLFEGKLLVLPELGFI